MRTRRFGRYLRMSLVWFLLRNLPYRIQEYQRKHATDRVFLLEELRTYETAITYNLKSVSMNIEQQCYLTQSQKACISESVLILGASFP